MLPRPLPNFASLVALTPLTIRALNHNGIAQAILRAPFGFDRSLLGWQPAALAQSLFDLWKHAGGDRSAPAKSPRLWKTAALEQSPNLPFLDAFHSGDFASSDVIHD